MRQNLQNEDFMRDYDKESLIINDYTVYHVFSWNIFTYILCFFAFKL